MRIWIIFGLMLTSCGSGKKEADIFSPEELISSRIGHLLTSEGIRQIFNQAEANDWRGKYNGDESVFEPITITKNQDAVKLDSIKPVNIGIYSFPEGYAVFDNRLHDSPVKHQGDRGTCTAFAMVAVLENLYWQESGADLDLSEEHLWSFYQEPDSEAAYTAVTNHDLILESSWQYGGAAPGSQDMNQSALRVRGIRDQNTDLPDLSDVIAAAGQGKSIYMAFGVSPSIHKNHRGVINPNNLGAPESGHAVSVSGVVIDHAVPGNGYFMVKNSWGSDWGDHGYGYIPFNYCEHYACEFRILDDIAIK